MATATITRPKKDAYVEEDIGNIILMEHVNVQIDDQAKATLFYLVGMGFTRDPHMMVGLSNMWVNLGEQQFHLPTGKPQVLRGHIGIVTPSIEGLEDRLESVKGDLKGTKFGFQSKGDYLEVHCPWGNEFHCFEPSQEFGNIRTGIPYIQFTVPTGTSEGIVAFYKNALDALATVEKGDGGKRAVVSVGQYQNLIFQETPDVPDYDGHHIAVYIANFSPSYRFLAQKGLVTEEPRNHQYRFVDIVDPKTGQPLFKIEHEVRGMKHPLFHRPLVNRNVGEFQEPIRRNGQTMMGTVR
jgi:hypothetical protein